jgi:hypothetical protein
MHDQDFLYKNKTNIDHTIQQTPEKHAQLLQTSK